MKYSSRLFPAHQRYKESLTSGRTQLPVDVPFPAYRFGHPLVRQSRTSAARQFERVFERVGDGLLILNSVGRILHANHRACAMLGCEHRAILGRPFSRYLNSSACEAYEDGLRRIVGGERREITIDAPLQSTLGLLHARATLSALDKVQTRIIVDLHDISELHNILAEKHQQETVTALAGATAHKLNQPLTAVIGYIQMLQRAARDTENQGIIEKIEQAAHEISELVREIGRITKFETNQYGSMNEILRIHRQEQPLEEKHHGRT